ncbi:MAG: TIGR04283 family arsenosugar biosynthesis glycosyltransferase [Pseudomonadota bacterium]
MGDPADITIIVPILNEEAIAEALIGRLGGYGVSEILIVDGGSTDDTLKIIRASNKVRVIESEPGRARQLQSGAEQAKASWLLFLHADTILPERFVTEVIQAERGRYVWGRFDVKFSPEARWFDKAMAVIAFFMNLRSRWSGIATGDQAMFVQRRIFSRMGGFAMVPLMEDIELSKRLKVEGKPYCSKHRVTTSARRWKLNGVLKTVMQMWSLRLAYFVGIDPSLLAHYYRQAK